jgi:hypothetical protein
MKGVKRVLRKWRELDDRRVGQGQAFLTAPFTHGKAKRWGAVGKVCRGV